MVKLLFLQCWRLINQPIKHWLRLSGQKQIGKHNASRGRFNAFIRAKEPKFYPLSCSLSLSLSLSVCQEAATGQNPVSSLHHWLALPQRTMEDIIKSNSAVYILLLVLVFRSPAFWMCSAVQLLHGINSNLFVFVINKCTKE